MSIFRRMIKLFNWGESGGSYAANPGSSFTASTPIIKPKGNRAARRREWRESWKEYKR